MNNHAHNTHESHKISYPMRRSVSPNYNPVRIFDMLYKRFKLRNDVELAALLDSSTPTICRIRHHISPFGASYILRTHELTGMSIAEITMILLGEPPKVGGRKELEEQHG